MGQVVLRLKNEAGGRSLVPRGPATAEVQTEPITGGDLSSQVFALGLCVWWCALNIVAPISAQGAERPLKGILYSPCCDVHFFSYDTCVRNYFFSCTKEYIFGSLLFSRRGWPSCNKMEKWGS